jgi:hypothetical protein
VKTAQQSVQPVFATICVHKHMHCIPLRTKPKVDEQWTRTRFVLVHNIGKIHTFGTLIQSPLPSIRSVLIQTHAPDQPPLALSVSKSGFSTVSLNRLSTKSK